MDLDRELAWLLDWVRRFDLLQPPRHDGRRAWPFMVEPLAQLGPWSRPGLATETDSEEAFTRALVQRLRPRDRSSKTLVLAQRPALRRAVLEDGRRDADRRNAALVEAHRELALAHPARAVDLAADAVRQLGETAGNRRDRPDAEALALGYYADALRFAGEATKAAQAFDAVDAALGDGAAQPAVVATVLALRAQLERDAGRPSEAEALLERAAVTAGSDRLVRAEVLLEHAALLGWLEETAGAWAKLEVVAKILPRTGPSPVFFLAVHTVAAGRASYFDAEAILEELAELEAADSPFDGPFFRAHRRWARSRGLGAIGDLDQARVELLAAFEGFLDLGRADWALRALGDLVLPAQRAGSALPDTVPALLARLVASPSYGWVRAREGLRWRVIDERRKAAWLRQKAEVAAGAVN